MDYYPEEFLETKYSGRSIGSNYSLPAYGNRRNSYQNYNLKNNNSAYFH